MMTKRLQLAALSIIIILALSIVPAKADNFIRVYATYSGTTDTVGIAEHFLVFGTRIPVFIAPYTLHFTIHPLTEDKYNAKVECYELGPGYKDFRFEEEIKLDQWRVIDGLESRGAKFDYHYVIFEDTVDIFNFLPKDSLMNFESVHFKSWLWRGSYAEYKWEMRKGYLEHWYNFFRKQHRVMRGGKIDLHVYPSSYSSPYINNLTGVGYDYPTSSMFTVFNSKFDSVLPQYAQLFVIYENLGYSARSLAVGYSRYLLDDKFRARFIVTRISKDDVKEILLDDYPANRDTADIICGAFASYIVDLEGAAMFKVLYEKSKPGYIATSEVYSVSIDEMIDRFIEYQSTLRLDEPRAGYISDLFNSQMWFDKALEYDIWLGSQPSRRDYHLKSLGATFFHLGDYEQSLKAYTTLHERTSDQYLPKYLLGQAHLRTGKTKQAIRMFEQVADTISEAAKMLTEIYLDKGDIKKAEKYISTVPEFPDSWTSLLKARLELTKGNKSLASAILKKALLQSNTLTELSPGESRGYLAAAYGFMMEGKFPEAESELEIALFVENRPYYIASCYLAMGRLSDLMEDRDNAIEYYQKVVDMKSGDYNKDLAKKYMKKAFKF